MAASCTNVDAFFEKSVLMIADQMAFTKMIELFTTSKGLYDINKGFYDCNIESCWKYQVTTGMA